MNYLLTIQYMIIWQLVGFEREKNALRYEDKAVIDPDQELPNCLSVGRAGSRNCLNGSPAALDCTLGSQPASHCQPPLGGASAPRLCVETISCYVIRSVGAVCVIWTFLSRNSSYLCRAFALQLCSFSFSREGSCSVEELYNCSCSVIFPRTLLSFFPTRDSAQSL